MTEKVTTVPEVIDAIEQVVSREQLAAAVETVLELLPLPPAEGTTATWTGGRRWPAGTPPCGRSSSMLASVIPWGCTDGRRAGRRGAARRCRS